MCSRQQQLERYFAAPLNGRPAARRPPAPTYGLEPEADDDDGAEEEENRPTTSGGVKRAGQPSPHEGLDAKSGSHSPPPAHCAFFAPPVHSSTPRKAARRVERLAADDDVAQPVLDAGQKALGATTCAQCGMFYTPELRRDAVAHVLYHERAVSGCRALCTLDARARRHLASRGGRHAVLQCDDLVIYRLRPDTRGALKSRFDAVLAGLVDEEIGTCERARPAWAPRRQGYMAVTSGVSPSVVAVALVDSISEARVVAPCAGGGGDSITSERVPASLGVHRIWVRPDRRRRGLAGRLLDAARRSAHYGVTVPVALVAFSDPTEAGAAFARSYCNGRLTVYDFAGAK